MLALGVLAALAASASVPASALGAFVAHRDVSYDLDSPPAPAPAAQNALDVYSPRGARRGSRPVVVYVHGGGWAKGDKANQIADKVELFTDAGYVFVSVNYRLSPTAATLDPGRLKHPVHAHDVGESLGWLDRNIARYGGDARRMLLTGHSAGAHLVSLVGSDPRWGAAYGVGRGQVRGVVSLDTAAFDVTAKATPGSARRRALVLFWNAFGTPAENAAGGFWQDASPLTWADAGDPPFLLVTQTTPLRVQENTRMAQALGQPGALLPVPLSHAAINDALGAPGDSSGVTPAVMRFARRTVGPGVAPRVRITSHPPRQLRIDGRRARVRFRFRSRPAGERLQCRLDFAPFRRCRSPQRYRLRPGGHRFVVRAASTARAPDSVDVFRFIIRRRSG